MNWDRIGMKLRWHLSFDWRRLEVDDVYRRRDLSGELVYEPTAGKPIQSIYDFVVRIMRVHYSFFIGPFQWRHLEEKIHRQMWIDISNKLFSTILCVCVCVCVCVCWGMTNFKLSRVHFDCIWDKFIKFNKKIKNEIIK